MNSLVINFVGKRYRARWAIAATAVACTALALGHIAYQLQPLMASLLVKPVVSAVVDTATPLEQASGLGAVDESYKLYAADAQRWATIAAFDSAGLLAALEATRVPNVRLTSVAIQPERAWASLDLASDQVEQVLAYVEELNRNDPTGAWVLRSMREAGGSYSGTAERSNLRAQRQR
jgi:hypothetical protein